MPRPRSDIGLDFLARACPACGGRLFRDLLLWEQLCYLLPIHFFKKANHRCHDCWARFTSSWNLVDIVFSLSFVLANLALGPFAVIGLVFLGAWSLVILGSRLKGRTGAGPVHIFFASLLLSMQWMFAILLNDWAPWMFKVRPGDGAPIGFAIMICAGLGCAFAVLYVDKRFGAPLTPRG